MKPEISPDENNPYDQWFLERVKEGRAAAKRGEFATEEQIEAVFNKYKPK